MAAAKKERVSPAQLGKMLEPPVSRQAVMRAIATGRLRKGRGGSLQKNDRGHWRIDPERALKEWEDWTDLSKSRAGQKAGGRPTDVPQTGQLFDKEQDKAARTEARVTHARAATDRILVDAELKRLELDERRGNLVDRRDVQTDAFTTARTVRDRMTMIPDRCASELASLTEPMEVRRRLNEEIVGALAALADEMEEPGEDGDD